MRDSLFRHCSGVPVLSFIAARSGIAGLMGSGRTPLMRAFLVSISQSRDRRGAREDFIDAQRNSCRSVWAELGYLSEDRKGEGLALNLSIADNITLTRFSSCARWGWLDLMKQRKSCPAVD